jgi:hypothetical protein
LLLILWAAITVLLAILLIYRSIIGMKQEGQIFLDPGGAAFESEQKQILSKLRRLAPIITGLAIASATLLLATGVIWVYRGLAGVDQ